MSLGLPENKRKIIKTIKEIEDDVSEILAISDEERYSYFNVIPETRIFRSKLEFALYQMRKEKLIKPEGIKTYSITKKGNQLLFKE